MAARRRAPAIAGSVGAPSGGEGGGSYLAVASGISPARGVLPTAVCVFLPQLLPPSALGRLAGLLGGDARFRMLEAWAERLPFPARGHAVVDFKAGRVVANAVPEDARRRLEEHRSRQPFLFPLPFRVPLSDDSLQCLYARVRDAVGYWYPLREPRIELFSLELEGAPIRAAAAVSMGGAGLVKEACRDILLSVYDEESWSVPARALAGAGLWALAALRPDWYWDVEEEDGWRRLELKEGAPVRGFVSCRSQALDTLPREALAAGPLGEAWIEQRGDALEVNLAFRLRRAGFETCMRILDADSAFKGFCSALESWQRRTRDPLRAAEARIPRARRLPLSSNFFWDLVGRIWEEGGKVKAWLPPERVERLRRELAELGWSPEDYLRRLSGELGRGVELVGEEPPFRWSPEVDEAYRRLKEAAAKVVSA
jgi:hypothetical protein